MIERYSLPEMKAIWTDEAKFERWLKVEIAACEGWAKLGSISRDDMEKIRQASFDMNRIEENLRITHHDVTAFLNAVAEKVGTSSRFIHLGLTSSDIMDTALSLQLVEASRILKKDLDELLEALKKRAVEFKLTIMIGRTHGVHAEPITFGLKLAICVEEMRRNAERLEQAQNAKVEGRAIGRRQGLCRHLAGAQIPRRRQRRRLVQPLRALPKLHARVHQREPALQPGEAVDLRGLAAA